MRIIILTLLLFATTALCAQELRFKHQRYPLETTVTSLPISYSNFAYHFTSMSMDDDERAARHKRKAKIFFAIGGVSLASNIGYTIFMVGYTSFYPGLQTYTRGTSAALFISSFALIAAGIVHQRKYSALTPKDRKDKWKRHLVAR